MKCETRRRMSPSDLNICMLLCLISYVICIVCISLAVADASWPNAYITNKMQEPMVVQKTISTQPERIRSERIMAIDVKTVEKANMPELNEPMAIDSPMTHMSITEPAAPTPCLKRHEGIFEGPSGHETWYDLPMQGVVRLMRDLGYSESEYPYWVRDDGVKMFGDYIMVAASLDIRPKGTILETSLGKAMVCDTGDFVKDDKYAVDVATDWKDSDRE